MGILQQHKLGIWLGGFYQELMYALSYGGIYNMLMLTIVAWHTTIYPIVSQNAPWLAFWEYLIGLALLALLIMLADYKFVMPSRQSFTNQQFYKHTNPLVGDMQQVLKELGELRKEIKELKDKLQK